MSCWITLPTDVKMADSFSFNQGSLITSDCDHNDYSLFGKGTARETCFDIRLKGSAVYEVVGKAPCRKI